MTFPGEKDLKVERRAFLETVESLDRDTVESGPTLCEGWSPRDVLAHVVAIDESPLEYLRTGLRIGAANGKLVERWRARPFEELLERARRWAVAPAWTTRIGAYGLLGDVAIHHQDVARPNGVSREIPPASSRAMLREGMILGGKKLLRYRVIPVDVGRPVGRGHEVRGTAEALGLWLCGRTAVEPELQF